MDSCFHFCFGSYANFPVLFESEVEVVWSLVDAFYAINKVWTYWWMFSDTPSAYRMVWVLCWLGKSSEESQLNGRQSRKVLTKSQAHLLNRFKKKII